MIISVQFNLLFSVTLVYITRIFSRTEQLQSLQGFDYNWISFAHSGRLLGESAWLNATVKNNEIHAMKLQSVIDFFFFFFFFVVSALVAILFNGAKAF